MSHSTLLSLAGKVAIITGGAQGERSGVTRRALSSQSATHTCPATAPLYAGIGAAAARLFAQHGAKLVIADVDRDRHAVLCCALLCTALLCCAAPSLPVEPSSSAGSLRLLSQPAKELPHGVRPALTQGRRAGQGPGGRRRCDRCAVRCVQGGRCHCGGQCGTGIFWRTGRYVQ